MFKTKYSVSDTLILLFSHTSKVVLFQKLDGAVFDPVKVLLFQRQVVSDWRTRSSSTSIIINSLHSVLNTAFDII